MRFAAVLWLTFAALLVVGGYWMLEACAIHLPFAYSRGKCVQSIARSAIADASARERTLRRQINQLELQIANLEDCPTTPVEQKHPAALPQPETPSLRPALDDTEPEDLRPGKRQPETKPPGQPQPELGKRQPESEPPGERQPDVSRRQPEQGRPGERQPEPGRPDQRQARLDEDEPRPETTGQPPAAPAPPRPPKPDERLAIQSDDTSVLEGCWRTGTPDRKIAGKDLTVTFTYCFDQGGRTGQFHITQSDGLKCMAPSEVQLYESQFRVTVGAVNCPAGVGPYAANELDCKLADDGIAMCDIVEIRGENRYRGDQDLRLRRVSPESVPPRS